MMLSIKIKIGIVEGYIKRVPTNGALFFIISEANEMKSITMMKLSRKLESMRRHSKGRME